MQRIIYTMHFRGKVSPTAPHSTSLRTTGSATSCTVSTVVRPSGMEASLQASEGELAFLESELLFTGPNSFQEKGTITFGDDGEHVLRFSTLNEGHFTRSPEPGTIVGTSSWNIEGGDGQFASARGNIVSAFTLGDSGDMSDIQCGLILLPE